MSRSHYTLRWDRRNVKPQSKYDNETLGGNLEVFCEKLQEEYGEDICDTLRFESKQEALYDVSDLQGLLDSFTEELESLRKTKGL